MMNVSSCFLLAWIGICEHRTRLLMFLKKCSCIDESTNRRPRFCCFDLEVELRRRTRHCRLLFWSQRRTFLLYFFKEMGPAGSNNNWNNDTAHNNNNSAADDDCKKKEHRCRWWHESDAAHNYDDGDKMTMLPTTTIPLLLTSCRLPTAYDNMTTLVKPLSAINDEQ